MKLTIYTFIATVLLVLLLAVVLAPSYMAQATLSQWTCDYLFNGDACKKARELKRNKED